MKKNPLPKYFMLLREAQAASDDVDYFDVIDDDPSSLAEFNRRCRHSNEAQLKLMGYILWNYFKLRRALKNV
jgi:hypothetical protein